jgi:hypothetical protein
VCSVHLDKTLSSLRWSHASWAAGLVAGIAVFSTAYLEWSFGFVATALIGLAAAACVLTAVAALIWGVLARRRIGLVSGASVLLVLAVSLALVREIDRRRKTESMRRGDTIFAALSSFRTDRGHYPNSLKELVPEFLPNVPSSAGAVLRDVPFHYRVSDRDGFDLGFPAPAWRVCHRTESTPWACVD